MGERALLAETVYQRIRRDLLRGRIRPGDRVTEEWAASHYSVSRTPVREACRRLAEEGLLTHRPHHGYRVPPISESEIDDLYDIRRALEVLAVRRAASAPAGEVIDRIAAEWCDEIPRASETVVYKDEAFHRELAGVAGNAQLVSMLDAINARIRFVRVYDFLDPARVAVTRQQHLAILDAVRRGDQDLAGALMHSHISESQRSVVAAAAQAAKDLARPVASRRRRPSRRASAGG